MAAAKPIRLSREAERQAYARHQAGDRQAGDLLARSVLPWACRLALQLSHGRDREEIESLAHLAVAEALKVFDPDRGRLTTLVAWRVRGVLAHVDPRLPIRIPRSSIDAWRRRARQGDQAAAMALENFAALSAAGRLDTSTVELEGREPPPEARLEAADAARLARRQRRRLADVLAMLPQRERAILVWRAEGRTLRQIGQVLELTRERVRQLEKKALASARRFAAALPESETPAA